MAEYIYFSFNDKKKYIKMLRKSEFVIFRVFSVLPVKQKVNNRPRNKHELFFIVAKLMSISLV